MIEKIQKPKMLIVDDSFSNRMLLSKIFGDEYTIELAENGLLALEMLKNHKDISVVILDLVMPEMDGLQVLKEMQQNIKLKNIPVVVVTSSEDAQSQIEALDAGAIDVLIKPLNPQIAIHRIRNIRIRNEASKLEKQNKEYKHLINKTEKDERTGLYNKMAFCRHTSELIKKNIDEQFLLVCWDIDHFKVFNDLFGISAGDKLLSYIGEKFKSNSSTSHITGHWISDHFVSCIKASEFNDADYYSKIKSIFKSYEIDFEFVVRIGVYKIDDPTIDVELMYDRALLSLSSIKNNYAQHVAYFEKAMRSELIEEQEIVSEMKTALKQGQFVVYFQPQFNYASKTLHGAEALVRWKHPKKGLIPPNKFIPIFEKNGFITQLDQYIWESVCKNIRAWIDKGNVAIPLSVNVSRIDIYNSRFCEFIENLTKKYNLDPAILRLEITESAYVENSEQLLSVVDTLREKGFCVEMDDFGSGYSSLNMLKEVPVDMLKLDMRFMESGKNSAKSGSILSSVVRMAQCIHLPVIAEGVETKEQADYLKSIGCIYMQGYYFAKPIPKDEFEELLANTEKDFHIDNQFSSDINGAENFLDASTQSTLLFNSFVGGAAIIEYWKDTVEALRMNDKYFEVLETTRVEYMKVKKNILDGVGSDCKESIINILKQAIQTGDEAECNVSTQLIHDKSRTIWIKLRVRFLSKNSGRYLFYLSINNITDNMRLIKSNKVLSENLKSIMESVPAGIVDFEISNKITMSYFNDNACTMFGYTREEYKEHMQISIYDFMHPDDKSNCVMKMNDVLLGKKILLSIRYRHLCKDGSYKWTQLNGRIVRRKNDITYASAFMLDIDAEMQNKEIEKTHELEKEQNRIFLNTVYNTIPCGIIQYTYDKDNYELMSYNNAAWQMLGYESQEHYHGDSRKIKTLELVHPEDHELVKRNFTEMLTSNISKSDFQARIISLDGKLKWLHILFHKIKYIHDEQILQVIITDITEHKKLTNSQFSNDLLDIYDEVFRFDVNNNTCTIISAKTNIHNVYNSIFKLSDAINTLCDKYVYDEDRQKVYDFFNSIGKRDNSLDSIVVYKYKNGDKKSWMSSTVFHKEDNIYLICNKEISTLE